MRLFKVFSVVSLVALMSCSNSALAASKTTTKLPRVLLGIYQGICDATSSTGDNLFMNPVRLKLSSKGIISGSAHVKNHGLGEYKTVMVKVKVKTTAKTRSIAPGIKATSLSTSIAIQGNGSIKGNFNVLSGGRGNYTGKWKHADYLGSCILIKQ